MDIMSLVTSLISSGGSVEVIANLILGLVGVGVVAAVVTGVKKASVIVEAINDATATVVDVAKELSTLSVELEEALDAVKEGLSDGKLNADEIAKITKEVKDVAKGVKTLVGKVKKTKKKTT